MDQQVNGGPSSIESKVTSVISDILHIRRMESFKRMVMPPVELLITPDPYNTSFGADLNLI